VASAPLTENATAIEILFEREFQVETSAEVWTNALN